MIEAAESDHRANRSRQLHQKINGMRKWYKGNIKIIRNNDEELIATKTGTAERWAEYFEQLLNGETPEKTFICIQEQPSNCGCEAPTLQKIKSQINRLRNHKSPDEDGI